jgi:hypothetical protein
VKPLTVQRNSRCYFIDDNHVSSLQEAVMATRRPTLLRWTEEAEAAQVSALAAFEREVQSAAARPVAVVPRPLSTRHRASVLPWLLSWFGTPDPQIARDDE